MPLPMAHTLNPAEKNYVSNLSHLKVQKVTLVLELLQCTPAWLPSPRCLFL